MDARRIALQTHPTGLQPELALVLVTVGPIQHFLQAVRKVPGLEWLGDIEAERAPDQFFRDPKKADKTLTSHLYLLMTDQTALQQLLSLFRQRDFRHGLTPWRDAFDHLDDIRLWGPEDRLAGLLADWREEIRSAQPEERKQIEVELWFRGSPARRRQAEAELRAAVQAIGGEVRQVCEIAEIHYHGALIDLPAQAVQQVVQNQAVRLTQCAEVMFFRPQAQAVAPAGTLGEPLLPAPNQPALEVPRYTPRVALLDSLPLERHVLLENGLIVDDPDEWAKDEQASARRHGTEMASLILRGDLSQAEPPLSEPIYVRPVLRGDGQGDASSPRDRLFVDFLYRAILRMVEVAPGVRVVNLSLGDRHRLYDGGLVSPWARLLDWLAARHGLLFVVSAGNHAVRFRPEPADRPHFEGDPQARRRMLLTHLEEEQRLRRLRVPAEAINALTIGAAHEDASSWTPDRRLDPWPSADLPSPISAQGPGIRRAIKPDLLAPGGRLLLNEEALHWRARVFGSRPPGLLVASVGQPGERDRTAYSGGTSHATALTTRAAARLLPMLDDLRAQHGADRLPETLTGVLLKALLVHGCDGRQGREVLAEALGGNTKAQRNRALRFGGHGHLNIERVLACTERRATVLACGFIGRDEGHRHELPLPWPLSGRRGLRRLTLTLAWLSPTHPASQRYRGAYLWFVPKPDKLNPLRVEREGTDTDHNAVRRGTVQHEVLEGESAAVFQQGAQVIIPVSCADDACPLDAPVPYALVATLEVGDEVDVPVYEAVREALRTRVRPAPGGAS